MAKYIAELKKCPKCGRFMTGDSIKREGVWYVHWRCLCGHVEEDEYK